MRVACMSDIYVRHTPTPARRYPVAVIPVLRGLFNNPSQGVNPDQGGRDCEVSIILHRQHTPNHESGTYSTAPHPEGLRPRDAKRTAYTIAGRESNRGIRKSGGTARPACEQTPHLLGCGPLSHFSNHSAALWENAFGTTTSSLLTQTLDFHRFRFRPPGAFLRPEFSFRRIPEPPGG